MLKRTPWIAVITLLLVMPPLLAKRSPGPTKLLGADESYQVERQGNRTVRLDTGAPITIINPGFRVAPGTPEEMARQYLAANWSSLGLQFEDLSDLEHSFTRVGKAATTVRFRQLTQGIPVLGSDVAVSINAENEVSFYTSSYVPAHLDSAIEARSAANARSDARQILGLTAPPSWEKTELVAYYVGGKTYLAHRVRQIDSGSLVGEWEVLSDAISGETLRVSDLAHYGTLTTGNGEAFRPDPLSTSHSTYGATGYVDGSDADTPQLIAEIYDVFLPEITESAGVYSLVSTYAEIVDTESPFGGLHTDDDGTWDVNSRLSQTFEATNTFYHIDRFMRYLNEDLGVTVDPTQYAGGARFDPHGLNGSDNSHYTSGNGVVAFGEGGVDDSEDADVVIHELGHAIHDWVTGGSLSQVNGLSEGTGDYFAQSYSRAEPNTSWVPGDAAYHYVFSWDGHNPFWGGRTTNYGAVYPGGLSGSIHTDGQIWATCNMKIWDEIGAALMDTAMVEGLAMTGSSTNQNDAGAAVMQAAIDMNFPADAQQSMFDIYGTCVYTVPMPDLVNIFADGFESGNTSQWSSTTP
ncbi:MAG: peptidase [Thermoanaerobaculia bacterium]|nr:peptidase [Thermoanaerobaculia bacterium]